MRTAPVLARCLKSFIPSETAEKALRTLPLSFFFNQKNAEKFFRVERLLFEWSVDLGLPTLLTLKAAGAPLGRVHLSFRILIQEFRGSDL